MGGHNERNDLYIVKRILKDLGKPESLITFVPDRHGHDRRYWIDTQKASVESVTIRSQVLNKVLILRFSGIFSKKGPFGSKTVKMVPINPGSRRTAETGDRRDSKMGFILSLPHF